MRNPAMKFVLFPSIMVVVSACMPINPIITQHHDNLVVVRVNQDLTAWNRNFRSNIGKEFYEYYEDEFNVLMMIST